MTRQFVSVFRNTDVDTRVDIIEMRELGIEFNDYNADDSDEIPVPATFVVEQDGSVSYAQSKGGGYRTRVELSDILGALK